MTDRFVPPHFQQIQMNAVIVKEKIPLREKPAFESSLTLLSVVY